MNETIGNILHNHDIKATSNRVLVLKALLESDRPMSLSEIEDKIDTLEKSSIFRTLTLFLNHGVVHTVEDGRGIVKYELCHGDKTGHCGPDDLHVHFYCEDCHELTCLNDIAVPRLELPEGYSMNSANFTIKGICPKCKAKKQ